MYGQQNIKICKKPFREHLKIILYYRQHPIFSHVMF